MIDPGLKNANILIVDDQPANIDVLESYLGMQGYSNVMSTTDPREVLRLYATFEPDLILLDLMMPFLSGFEVMAQIQPLTPEGKFLPVLVLTADATADAKEKALSGGASDFLTKPFDLVEVGLRIRNLLLTAHLVSQMKDQNALLDSKVRERTEELQKSNTELIIARDKAEAGDRLKTAFMQNISHEVRTPLNGILGISTLITDPELPDEEKQQFIPLLQTSAYRLMKTITDYMDISQIASGNLKVNLAEVDPVAILKEIRTKYEDVCNRKKLDLVLELPETGSPIILTTDPELLEKSLNQLVDNAVKFTALGSVAIGCSRLGNDIRFYVRDTGIGISPEASQKIFDHFAQEDISITRGYEGSGLGLSIVKGILGLLGGWVSMSSEKGKGSEFEFSLPAGKALTMAPESVAQPPGENDLRESVIMIAEDDLTNQMYMELILRKSFQNVLQAYDGLQAVEMCRRHPEISAILMDIKMPHMDGLEATREIRKFRPDVPVIAVTAFAMSGDRLQALEAGCSDYLPKPVKRDELMAMIRKYLE